jgi:hypothetical protein
MDVDWMKLAQKMAQAARAKVAEDRRQLQDLRDLQAKRQLERVHTSSQ